MFNSDLLLGQQHFLGRLTDLALTTILRLGFNSTDARISIISVYTLGVASTVGDGLVYTKRPTRSFRVLVASCKDRIKHFEQLRVSGDNVHYGAGFYLAIKRLSSVRKI